MNDVATGSQLPQGAPATKELASWGTLLHEMVREYCTQQWGGFTSLSLSWNEERVTGLVTVAVAQPDWKPDRVWEFTVREVPSGTEPEGLYAVDLSRLQP